MARATCTLRNEKAKEAQQELDRILAQINRRNGNPLIRERVLFAELMNTHWPAYLDNKGVKDSTRASYVAVEKKWILPFFGELWVAHITPGTVSEFMSHLKRAALSEKYRLNIYLQLNSIFQVAVENELLEATLVKPRIHRPKVTIKRRQGWTLEQAQAFLVAVEEPWKAPIHTLAMTGLRLGELLALQWQDIDFLNQRIIVQHSLYRSELQSTKTEDSQASLAMPQPLVELLSRHRSESSFGASDNFVFCRDDGSPLDPDSLRRLGMYPALRTAGIPFVPRHSGPHALRHLARIMQEIRIRVDWGSEKMP